MNHTKGGGHSNSQPLASKPFNISKIPSTFFHNLHQDCISFVLKSRMQILSKFFQKFSQVFWKCFQDQHMRHVFKHNLQNNSQLLLEKFLMSAHDFLKISYFHQNFILFPKFWKFFSFSQNSTKQPKTFHSCLKFSLNFFKIFVDISQNLPKIWKKKIFWY